MKPLRAILIQQGAMAGLLAIATAVVLTLGWMPEAEARSTVSILKISDRTVTASFLSVDTTGCIETRVDVLASTQVQSIVPRASTTTAQTALIITRIDQCTGNAISTGDGVADVHTLDIPSNLQTATLAGTVPVTDHEGTVHPFTVNLSWTATGPATRDHAHDVVRDDQFGILISGVRGTHVPAVATGSLVGLGENWITGPSTAAEIISGAASVVTIQRAP